MNSERLEGLLGLCIKPTAAVLVNHCKTYGNSEENPINKVSTEYSEIFIH